MSEQLSEARANIYSVQSTIQHLANKLAAEDIQKISTNLHDFLITLEEIAKSPGVKSRKSSALTQRLAHLTGDAKRTADSLTATDEEHRTEGFQKLMQASNQLKDEALSTKGLMYQVVYRPTRISIFSIFIIIGAIITIVSSVSYNVLVDLLGISVSLVAIVSAIGLRRMRQWAAQLLIIVTYIGIIVETAYASSGVTIPIMLWDVLILAVVMSARSYYRPPSLPLASAFGRMRLNYLSSVAGIQAIISIAIPWWSYTSSASLSVSPLDLNPVAPILLLLGGLLGLVGMRLRRTRIFGLLVLFVAMIVTIGLIAQHPGVAEIGLFGSLADNSGNVYAFWSLTSGVLIVAISMAMLLLSLRYGQPTVRAG